MLGITLKQNYNQFKIHFASSKLFVVLKKRYHNKFNIKKGT